MDKQSLYVARLIFQNFLLKYDGNAFESLFTKIMQSANNKFLQVKPQGTIGDRSNDGFDKITGTYYQVFAPENINKYQNRAIKKLNEDFTNLYSYWNPICPIKNFFYVINDKYKGAYPTLHTAILHLRTAYPDVTIDLFMNNHLEDIFIKLDEDSIINIVGYIPKPDICSIEFSLVKDVVDYMMTIKVAPINEFIPKNPNFEEKIKFNVLSQKIAEILNIYRSNVFVIEDFFSLNSDFAKNELRNKFNGLYNEAINTIDTNVKNRNDQVFFYIRNNAFNKHNPPIDSVIFTLMSYYFEYCDIYQSPEL